MNKLDRERTFKKSDHWGLSQRVSRHKERAGAVVQLGAWQLQDAGHIFE